MTSIFNNRTIPPYGTYYITNFFKNNEDAINSIITISNTKLIFETKYKNDEYIKKEFPFPLTAEKNDSDHIAYVFKDINMGSYRVEISIIYYGEQPLVGIGYYKGEKKPEDFDFWLESPTLDKPKPKDFYLDTSKPISKPISVTARDEKSFFNKYLIYIVLLLLVIIISVAAAYLVIKNKNKKPTISQ